MPGLNMSSMPDLIFTVLFFFMIATHIRSVPVKVKAELPQGTELTKLTKRSSVVHIYIGEPLNMQGEGTRIQLNDRFAEADQVETFIRAERAGLSSEDRKQMTVSIKADKHTDMGTVTAVKQQLRKAGALRINYSAKSR